MSTTKINRRTGSLPPWATAAAGNWANASKAIVLADMSRCSPSSALAETSRRKHWKVIPYEAGGITGKLIWASPDADAPQVTLPLDVTGWHAIFVGLYATRHTPGLAWLKLAEDKAPVPRASCPKRTYWGIQEVFFKVAELKKDSLHIRQQSSGMTRGCGVAYAKLIPLAADEVSGVRADRARTSDRRLTATCDGISFLYTRAPTTMEELLAEVELFRNTDFGMLLLHLGGADQVTYRSKYGFMTAQETDSFPDSGYRHCSESIRKLADQGINPTKVLIEAAHDVGMKVHVGIRPALWTYYEPLKDTFDSPFYRQHPQWRIVDRDGTVLARMSWAVPEVRSHLMDVLREAVGFGADGAHIVFNRGWPMVLYEPAFCELFIKQHGVDPKTLDETDPRIRKLHCDVVLTFMRELRTMLDDEATGRADGNRLEISVCVLGDEADNLRYSLDVRRLVAEGLVDEIHSYKYGFGESKREWDMKFFREVCGPKGVRISPMFSIIDPIESHIREAIALYEQGADGLGFWDAFCEDIDLWSTLSRFGRMDELKRRLEQGIPEPLFLPVHMVGGEILDGRYPIFWGG